VYDAQAVEDGDLEVNGRPWESTRASGAGRDREPEVVGGRRRAAIVLEIAASVRVPWSSVIDEGCGARALSGSYHYAAEHAGVRNHVRAGFWGGVGVEECSEIGENRGAWRNLHERKKT
jgi:hypothetical protein